jgi:hypothetical protein
MSPADNLPTVKISDGAGGFIIINATDFIAGQHEKYEAPIEVIEDVVAPILEEEPAVTPKPALRKRQG